MTEPRGRVSGGYPFAVEPERQGMPQRMQPNRRQSSVSTDPPKAVRVPLRANGLAYLVHNDERLTVKPPPHCESIHLLAQTERAEMVDRSRKREIDAKRAATGLALGFADLSLFGSDLHAA